MNLSEVSRRSLVFHGDTTTKEAARLFELLPHFAADWIFEWIED